MNARSIYDTGRSKTLGWPMMLADMGLLLMAFFALMVAQSNTSADAIKSSVEPSVTRIVPKDAESLLANLRENRIPFESLDLPMPLDLPDASAPTEQDRIEDLRRALITHVTAPNFSVERAGDSIVVSLGAVGNFAPGSADLDAAALRTIHAIVGVIGETSSEIAIEGHADAAPVVGARFKDNWELAGARAVSVLREFSRFPALSASSLRAVSFGDRRPVIMTDDPKERERNRRVEIRIRPI
jgi:chemotaxis protein MotB